VREELAFGLENLGMPRDAMDARIDETLRRLGIDHLADREPFALSGGEQQRVAVARALANDPDVVLADEPSGNLDHAHSERLHDLLASLTREFETALVVVTHNRLLAARADRVLAMEGGRLVPVAGVEAAS